MSCIVLTDTHLLKWTLPSKTALSTQLQLSEGALCRHLGYHELPNHKLISTECETKSAPLKCHHVDFTFLFVSNGKKGKVYTNYIHEYWTRNNSNTSYRRLKIKYKTSPRSLMKNQLPTPPLEVQLVQTMPPQRKGHTRPCSLLGAR